MNFRGYIKTSTKVADNLTLGDKFELSMFSGKATFTVTSVEGDNARATSGHTIALLERLEDGWYDSHFRVAESAVVKLENFEIKALKKP